MPDPDDAVEIEIKLRIAPDSRIALERHPAFKLTSPPHIQHEATTYFDTPDHALSSRGATLRVRRRGRHREQTLKVTGHGRTPLQRGEWNWPADSDAPDPQRLIETSPACSNDSQGLIAAAVHDRNPALETPVAS